MAAAPTLPRCFPSFPTIYAVFTGSLESERILPMSTVSPTAATRMSWTRAKRWISFESDDPIYERGEVTSSGQVLGAHFVHVVTVSYRADGSVRTRSKTVRRLIRLADPDDDDYYHYTDERELVESEKSESETHDAQR